jgi:hypothetical protein
VRLIVKAIDIRVEIIYFFVKGEGFVGFDNTLILICRPSAINEIKMAKEA